MKHRNKILGIIPARKGSKGIKLKNIKNFNGKPLIFHTINVAKKSKLIDNLIVSTDSKDIAKIAQKYGVDVPFLRPKKYSNDKSSDLELMHHALSFYHKKNIIYDAVILLRPTTVFKKVKYIDESIKLFFKNKFDSLRSISNSRYSPYLMYKIKDKNIIPLFNKKFNSMRRQDLPESFQPNGLFEIISSKNILEKKLMYGPNTGFYKVENEEALLDIDTELDFLIAQFVKKIKN